MVIGLVCMLGVAALWSFVPVLVKLLLPVFDPFTIAFLRLSQAWVVVLAVFFARGHRLRDIRLSWWHLVGGLGISCNMALYALSLSYTTASVGVLVVQVQYVTLAVLAAALLHERLGPGKIAGMALVLAGIVAVVGLRADMAGLLAPHYALGNALMLVSGLGWGLYALANKALIRQARTSLILVPMLTVGTVLVGLLAVIRLQFHSEPAYDILNMNTLNMNTLAMILALGALATGGSYILVSEGMKRLSAVLVGTVAALTPIGQIAMAHAFLAEKLTLNLAGGGIIVLAGVLCMVYAEKSQVRQR
jgi:drug/metabolite transporter (DMT)-like permease